MMKQYNFCPCKKEKSNSNVEVAIMLDGKVVKKEVMKEDND